MKILITEDLYSPPRLQLCYVVYFFSNVIMGYVGIITTTDYTFLPDLSLQIKRVQKQTNQF